MIRGSKLHCIGIIGDGCGGGREFFIEKSTLFVYDPITKTTQTLYEGIEDAKEISKKGCELFIQTSTQQLVFNLSTMSLEHI